MEQQEVEKKIEGHLAFLKEELTKVRTGRANASLIEDIQVDYYGAKQPLKGLGTIRSLDPQTLVVEPWDKGAVEAIAGAITKAQNGLSAVAEGERVRIPFPPLSEERRKEFIRLAGQKTEETKIKLRQLRDEAMKDLEQQEKAGKIGEDEEFRRKEKLEEIFKKNTKTIDELKDAKEKELAAA